MKMRSYTWSRWGILIVLLFMVISGCTTHEGEEKTAERKAAEERADALNLAALGDSVYVGSAKCKECHWREHDSWKHTLHSKFVQVANEQTVIGDFTRNNTLSIKVTSKSPKLAGNEVSTKMYKKDGKYFVKTTGPDWKQYEYEISHVIGIDRKQNYLTKLPNGALHVLPVEWEVNKLAWEDEDGLENHYPGDGKYWSDPGKIWQYKCGSCHVTGMKINYNKTSDSYNTTWIDLGIGCEACHGAGSKHIKVAREFFAGEKDSIINPAKLPWKLRAAVCGQCHNWGTSAQRVTPYNEGLPINYAFPYGYKVGQPLYLFYDEELDEEHRHHQQYNEWETSEHAKAGVMCTTCHAVHQEGMHKNPHKALTKYIGDSLCENCHKTLLKKAAHRIHTFGSCIACHMPKLKGTEHSHTFEFVSPEVSLRAGGVDKKSNSCSGCHHHKDNPLTGLIEFLDTVKKEDMPVPFTVHGR
jgi:hypothetical protein